MPGGDELIDQPYVPIDVAALAGGGLLDEIPEQLSAATPSCDRPASIRPRVRGSTPPPRSRPPAPPTSRLGLQAAQTDRLVLADSNLASAGSSSSPPHVRPDASPSRWAVGPCHRGRGGQPALRLLQSRPARSCPGRQPTPGRTRVHPFREPVQTGRPGHRPGATGFVAALVPGVPGDTPRGDVGQPGTPAGHPQPVLLPGPQGRQRRADLPSPPIRAGTPGRSRPARPGDSSRRACPSHLAERGRERRSSPGHLTELSDQLLATQNRRSTRSSAPPLSTSTPRHFNGRAEPRLVGRPGHDHLHLAHGADPRSRSSPTRPTTINVVVSVDSDKFTFPDGNSRALTLDRPTTAVRIAGPLTDLGRPAPRRGHPDDTRRSARHRPHHPDRALHLDLARRRGPDLPGRPGPAGVVGPHVARPPSAAPAGRLT